MSNPGSIDGVPALFRELGNWIGDHFREIGALSGIGSLLIVILNVVFEVRLKFYGDAFANIVTSDSFLVTILIIIAISQIMVYQRVVWIVGQLETGSSAVKDEAEREEEAPEPVTDGGQPRDSNGRFKAENSGGSNFLLILLAGAGGYLIASDYSAIDPVAGALIGIMVISFVQSMSD